MLTAAISQLGLSLRGGEERHSHHKLTVPSHYHSWSIQFLRKGCLVSKASLVARHEYDFNFEIPRQVDTMQVVVRNASFPAQGRDGSGVVLLGSNQADGYWQVVGTFGPDQWAESTPQGGPQQLTIDFRLGWRWYLDKVIIPGMKGVITLALSLCGLRQRTLLGEYVFIGGALAVAAASGLVGVEALAGRRCPSAVAAPPSSSALGSSTSPPRCG
jgi:hypothetical protein